MFLILLILALGALRYFEVWKFAEMSWWYVIGLMVFAFIWFEYIEKILGLDKRKTHDVDQQRRKERVRKAFEDNKKRR